MKSDTEILFHALANEGKAISDARRFCYLKYGSRFNAAEAEQWIAGREKIKTAMQQIKNQFNNLNKSNP